MVPSLHNCCPLQILRSQSAQVFPLLSLWTGISPILQNDIWRVKNSLLGFRELWWLVHSFANMLTTSSGSQWPLATDSMLSEKKKKIWFIMKWTKCAVAKTLGWSSNIQNNIGGLKNYVSNLGPLITWLLKNLSISVAKNHVWYSLM